MKNDFDTLINGALDPIFDNKTVQVVVYIFLGCYAFLAAPSLPLVAGKFIFNNYFRVAVIGIIAWTFSHDPVLSILIAVSFFMSITYLSKNSFVQLQQTNVVTENIAQILNVPSNQQLNNVPLGKLIDKPLPLQPLTNSTGNNALVTTTGEVKLPGSNIKQDMVTANVPDGMEKFAAV